MFGSLRNITNLSNNFERLHLPSTQPTPLKVMESKIPSSNERPEMKCKLCNNEIASERCSTCSLQWFCFECDRLYHSHSRRQNHIRQSFKLPNNEENENNQMPSQPINMAAHPSKMPIPPPRRKKKICQEFGSLMQPLMNGYHVMQQQQPPRQTSMQCTSYSSSFQDLPLMQQFTSINTEQQIMPTQLHQIRARMLMNSNQAQMQKIQTLVQWNRLKEQQQQQMNIRATSLTQLHMFDPNMLPNTSSGFGSQLSLQARPSFNATSNAASMNYFGCYNQTNGAQDRSASAINLVNTGRSPSPAQFARMDRNAVSPSYERWMRLQMNSPSPRPSSNLLVRRPEPVRQLSRRHLSLNDVRANDSSRNRVNLNSDINHNRRSAHCSQDGYFYRTNNHLSSSNHSVDTYKEYYEDDEESCSDDIQGDIRYSSRQRQNRRQRSVEKGINKTKVLPSHHRSVASIAAFKNIEPINERKSATKLNRSNSRGSVVNNSSIGSVHSHSSSASMMRKCQSSSHLNPCGNFSSVSDLSNGWVAGPQYAPTVPITTHPFYAPAFQPGPAIQAVPHPTVYTGYVNPYSPMTAAPTITQPVYFVSNNSNTISPASSMHSLHSLRRKGSEKSVESANSEQIQVFHNQAQSRSMAKKSSIKLKEKEETRYKLVRVQASANSRKMIIMTDEEEEEDNYDQEEENEESDHDKQKQNKHAKNQQIDKRNKSQMHFKMNGTSSKVNKSQNSIPRTQKVKSGPEKTSWKCVQCKFLNRSLTDVCEICFRKNPWHKASSLGQRSVQIEDRRKLFRSTEEDTDDYENEYQGRKKKKSFCPDKRRYNPIHTRYSDDENDYAEFSDTSDERAHKTFKINLKSINRANKNKIAHVRNGYDHLSTDSRSMNDNEENSLIEQQIDPTHQNRMELNQDELDFLSGQSIDSSTNELDENGKDINKEDLFGSNETVIELKYQNSEQGVKGERQEDEKNEEDNNEKDDMNSKELEEINDDDDDDDDDDEDEDIQSGAVGPAIVNFHQNKLYQNNQKRSSESKKTIDSQMPKLFTHMRQAEQSGYDLEQLQIAVQFAPDQPVEWLQRNWAHMVETVMTLSNNQLISDPKKKCNESGPINCRRVTLSEAAVALRQVHGNIWSAVDLCAFEKKTKKEEGGDNDVVGGTSLAPLLYKHTNIENTASSSSLFSSKEALLSNFGHRSPSISPQIIRTDSSTSTTKIFSLIDHNSGQDDQQALAEMDPGRSQKTTSYEVNLGGKSSDLDIFRSFQEIQIDEAKERELSHQNPNFGFARTIFECPLCLNSFHIDKLKDMIWCTHRTCADCFVRYFTHALKERQSVLIGCPVCGQPDFGDAEMDDDAIFNYLQMLDMQLRPILSKDMYDLFQKKMTERNLHKDPNFRWCPGCTGGYKISSKYKETSGLKCVSCPLCNVPSCIDCGRVWQKEHKGISCTDFARFMDTHPLAEGQKLDPSRQWEQNIIQCPKCQYKFELSRGGCIHMHCLHCGYDFCSGCNARFLNGSKCNTNGNCARMGFHAHHPRNCFFYLRDLSKNDLELLLQQNNCPFRLQAQCGLQTKCNVMVQRELPTGLRDEPCLKPIEEGNLCTDHYREYLGALIQRKKIDPLPVLTEDEIIAIFNREFLLPPVKVHQHSYRTKLIETLQRQCPLK